MRHPIETLRRAVCLRLAVVGSSAQVRPPRHIGDIFCPVFTAAAALVSIALLSGCAATGGISALGLANGALTGALAGVAPTISVDQILETYAVYHNLKVQLETIDSMGIVTTTTQTPVVVTGTPMTPPPVVVSPAPPVTTAPPPPSSGPVVTPNTRYRRRVQSIGRIPPDTIHANEGSIGNLSAAMGELVAE